MIEDWSRTAIVYQFSATQMGFLFGATGSGHILTVINDRNEHKEFADFIGMNENKSCMVTYEKNLKKMPNSLVFYSVPDFRVRLVLNQKVPQFKKLTEPTMANFEENGDFSFQFSSHQKGETELHNVLIQNPCQSDHRIIMN